ncbi:MAG: DUF2804 domain-containing protein [Rectinemataceae bacterium]|nr:DUF2804 domain-containing protein [Rectinemataceae bacterium]
MSDPLSPETSEAATSAHSPPEALVRDGNLILGSWEGVPGKANLLDIKHPYHYPLPRFLKRLRLKEWQAVEAGDEDWFLIAVLYDAKFFSMAVVDLWNRKEKKKYGFRRIFPGSRFSLPDSLELSESHATGGGDHLSIRIDPASGFVELRASSRARKRSRDSFELDLRFDLSEGASSLFSVCLPLGLNRAMYSTKVLMPCSGRISLAESEHDFDPAKASGILDDHKGFYPYRLHYDWVTGFGIDASGRRIGFNLTDNQVKDQERYNENRLWIDGRVEPLPPVTITRPYGRESPWVIQDTEGMVDLVFQPEVPHNITMNLGIAEIDYAGPFGRFEGRLRSASGESIHASLFYGMGEDKNVRL